MRALGSTHANPPLATGVAAWAEPARTPVAIAASAKALAHAIRPSCPEARDAHHPIRTIRATPGPATLGAMGIRQWFSRHEKEEDEEAIKRAEDEMRSGSYEEREAISGDIEGMAADNRAERRGDVWSGGDPRSGF